MVEVQVAEQHDADTALFGQGELDTNRASIQEYGVINQESATLLTDRPVPGVHKTIGPVTTQYSNLHLDDDYVLVCGRLPGYRAIPGRIS